MELALADYVILAAALAGGAVGLFVGFSGALSFLAGSLATAAAIRFGWPLLEQLLPVGWQRVLATVLAAILVFGCVRWAVKKFVHALVAQPSDAIFGALVAGLTGLCLAAGGIWFAGHLAGDGPLGRSAILERVLPHGGV